MRMVQPMMMQISMASVIYEFGWPNKPKLQCDRTFQIPQREIGSSWNGGMNWNKKESIQENIVVPETHHMALMTLNDFR